MKLGFTFAAQVDGLRVFGVAIPTVAGLRRALNSMGAQRGESYLATAVLRDFLTSEKQMLMRCCSGFAREGNTACSCYTLA